MNHGRRTPMKITLAAASALLAVCLNSSVAVSQIRSDNSPATNVFPNNVYPNDPNEYLRRQPVRGSDAPGHHEPRVINGGPLAPPVADRDVFRAFLKTKQTGLLRLIPREVYRG